MADFTLTVILMLVVAVTAQAEVNLYKKIGEEGPRQKCDHYKFSCNFNNPCNPPCSEEQTVYPGPRANKYVRCTGVNNAYCTINKCPRGTSWSQQRERCEGENGQEARCAKGTYNCDSRNPCYPSLCNDNLNLYPSVWSSKYVSCGECGECTINNCGPDKVWDQELLECVDDPGSGEGGRCDSNAFDCEANNPCSPELCTDGKTYYSHSDPAMYVQCGSGAMCFVMPCAPGTVWNDDIQNCDFSHA